MASLSAHRPKVQWRWDRFNAKKVTTVTWASRNCVGADPDHLAMQKLVMEDKRRATMIITLEQQQLLREGAAITGMTYTCKHTNHALACINSRDIRASWIKDGSEANLKRMAWMFYFYGCEIYKNVKGVHHGVWVEQKVLDAFNVEYVHITELDIKQRTCVEQLYSHTMNGLRTNILRRNPQFQHASLVRKEQPKVLGFFKKHFKRSKTTFFVTQKETDVHSWCKVSLALHYLGKGSHYWQLTTVRSGETLIPDRLCTRWTMDYVDARGHAAYIGGL